MSGTHDTTQQPFDEAWPATAENVGAARRAVRRWLDDAETSDPPTSDITLAVSEAVTNAIRHAYVERETGEVRVRVRLSPDEIAVTVEDDGRGIQPRTDSPGLGLGLPLIATLAQHLDLEYPDAGGARIQMTFLRHPEAATLPE